MKKIALLGHQEITKIVAECLLENDIEINSLISLKYTIGSKISEYVNLQKFAEKNKIKYVEIDDYSLKKDELKSYFFNEKFDIIFVVGWSRLIPDKLLKLTDTDFIGWHGGPFLPPRCRGRAVVNWALINNETDFFLYTMLINEGIDAGNIIDKSCLLISDDETAQSLYLKCAFKLSEFFNIYAKSPSRISGKRQSNDGATYLPQRSPEDGEIDWKLPARSISRLIRALSQPFPNAWSKLNGKVLLIKRAKVLDLQTQNTGNCGRILHVLNSGEIIVTTGNGLLLIEDFEYNSEYEFEKNQVFEQSQNIRNITKTY